MLFGWTENQVLDMPLDKFRLYLEAAQEVDLHRRRGVVMDTQAAIGAAFSEDGATKYLNTALSGESK